MRPYPSRTPPWGWGKKLSPEEAAVWTAERELDWLKASPVDIIQPDERETTGRLPPMAQRPA